MYDFLKFVDRLRKRMAMHVEIYYSKVMDWTITITMKGCADDYPESERIENDALLVNVQDCDMELAFAKAHVQLKEWLVKHDGGY